MTTAEPQLVPLNAIFAEDFVQILVPIMSDNTIGELADAIAHHTEGRRVPKKDLPKVVFHEGKRLDPSITVAEAGIGPLDHVRVEYEES
ncbi:toluene-4-monooxygenase system B family protein [Pseudonocardia sp.]|jgi:toluene monooxygenase system protein B|uniref:toluene-4-monooxygenase system B family protein n=1 Tax=Pseudonocardia sp. TaxID=60912 RepID=UPI00262E4424|nr:toluene-4-monooxygenase system B family protein [Pseudonocardia sp.]MCW2721022.1 Toluene-4-monooxygenase system [Pseudonocardia sp.]MDT7615479.1 toluene monooxygenase system protein [Pseudonocardiales bacterium]